MGAAEALGVFLQHGATVNLQDKHGHTPLHIATFRSHADLAVALVAGGASPNVPSAEGLCALSARPPSAATLRGGKAPAARLKQRLIASIGQPPPWLPDQLAPECQLCAVCSKPANRWTSPMGQVIETVTTRTQPRFTFAYNPFDDDMSRMRKTAVLEPTLTHAWHEATAKCCRDTKGLVIDVGGNYGWFTLYSVALGCSVAVFEPVPAYQEIIRLGLRLNPGFAERVTLYGNVVTTGPPGKTYSLMVPVARPAAAGAARRGGKKETLGMTAMVGAAGPGKDPRHMKGASVREHRAKAARIDDVIGGAAGHPRDVCVLKADVEGYEAQVLQTAERLLAAHRVATLIFEVTKWSVRDGTRAAGTARVSLGQELSRPQPRCTHSSRHVAASVPEVAFSAFMGSRTSSPAGRRSRATMASSASRGRTTRRRR